jgi:hypothetical protein
VAREHAVGESAGGTMGELSFAEHLRAVAHQLDPWLAQRLLALASRIEAQDLASRIVARQDVPKPTMFTAELIRRANAAGFVSLWAYVEALENAVLAAGDRASVDDYHAARDLEALGLLHRRAETRHWPFSTTERGK